MTIPASLFPLVTALVCNLIAQVLKTIFYYLKSGEWDLHWVVASGGFPSSHSSTVTGLSMAIGIQEGFNSALFAVTAIFAFIVMYDACHVRYYSGKNIELTQQLIKDLKDEAQINIDYDEPIYKEQLKAVLGHKFTEVIGGFIIGLLVPLFISPLFL
ncbi:MAG: divergent PAP2 family protein [Absicoccus sp.]|jgi:acid phosphatase family membrane protein YuiD|uniref:Divergent PAP2 family protein n=1 Tax=Absicoccus intestinalis TaxID=2926319 RepID=A0ABU4WPH6_9FIRM|nr:MULTISPECIES: divergent PAP2 family protein [unclassified Absicoccus]MDX8417415.1 divergent PAP2 family protein [Absicoccus sp. CLA-KB-P134]MDY3034731.1 divergent PAP2 family protein [Absicoccus sp.]